MLEATLLVFAGLAFLAVLGMVCSWWRLDVVLSGSMAPTLQPGAVIVAVSEPDSRVAVGQVLAFHPPDDPNLVVTHRVIQVIHRDGKVEIRTRGDENNTPDAWTAVLQGNTVWHVSWVWQGAGYVVIWATVLWVRIVALVAFILILMGAALARVWRQEPR
jgi:signal peptidase